MRSWGRATHPLRVSLLQHLLALNVTPEELAGLVGMVDDLLRPYLVPVRENVPEGAAPVHFGVRAFIR